MSADAQVRPQVVIARGLLWAGPRLPGDGMASRGAVLMGTTDDPVPDAEGHDPDQCCRSTVAQ